MAGYFGMVQKTRSEVTIPIMNIVGMCVIRKRLSLGGHLRFNQEDLPIISADAFLLSNNPSKHGNQGIGVSSLPFIVLLTLPELATACPALICRDCLEPNPEAASRPSASAACWRRIGGVTPSKDRRSALVKIVEMDKRPIANSDIGIKTVSLI
jgi:hypothetical protein